MIFMERLDKIIAFLKEAEKLKLVEREIYLSNGIRKENSAEHSWYMCVILMLLEKEFKEIDLLKMYRMFLIHDLVEIYAGDVCAFDKQNKVGQNEKEKEAAEKLFNLLPEDLKEDLHQLWLEYETKTTKEAKLAQAFDKISAELQQVMSEGKSLKEWKVKHEDVFSYKKEFIDSDETTKRIAEKINEEIRKIDL